MRSCGAPDADGASVARSASVSASAIAAATSAATPSVARGCSAGMGSEPATLAVSARDEEGARADAVVHAGQPQQAEDDHDRRRGRCVAQAERSEGPEEEVHDHETATDRERRCHRDAHVAVTVLRASLE